MVQAQWMLKLSKMKIKDLRNKIIWYIYVYTILYYAIRKYQSTLAYLENIWKNVKWLPKISEISTKT